MDINTSVKKVRGYAAKVARITASSLRRNQKLYAKWNVQQMEKGLRPDGSIQDDYSPSTATWPGRTGPATGPIKLKDKGDFHKSVVRETKEIFGVFGIKSHASPVSSILFTGDYIKGSTDLEKQFGPLFGLTEPNFDKMADITFDDLYKGLEAYWK